MKLLEKFIYSGVTFLVFYVIISVALRVMKLTSDYTSHMIGGIVATVFGVGVFMYLIIKK
jgi:hypothetical protein